jgi:hypothetical protein
MRRHRAAFERDILELKRTRKFAEPPIDENPADIILREQQIDDPLCRFAVTRWPPEATIPIGLGACGH